ncbi:MAG: hypothetical protein WC119_00130 [Synergistaceae bacterium]
MIPFYLLLIIYCFVTMFIHFKFHTITWYEWLGVCLIGFAVTGVFHAIAVHGMTADNEIWSGQITRAVHYPRWIEEYQVAIYKTVTHTRSDGSTYTTSEFSHYETRHRTHPEHWQAETSITRPKEIDKKFFNEIVQNFGDLTTEKPHKSGFDSGDPNIYVAYNKTGYVYPITDIRSFKNKIKASPSVFSFSKVPEGTPVYEYPYSHWLVSARLIGTASTVIDITEFDRLNSRLGPTKRVNVIIVGFNSLDSQLGQWQEAKWIGGKKNDLVICYGGTTNANWAYCFGWTEQEIVKRNIETIFLKFPVNDDILLKIENEIRKNYVIKDWSKFDYIRVEPPRWAFMILVIIFIGTQGGLWAFAHYNDFTDEDRPIISARERERLMKKYGYRRMR